MENNDIQYVKKLLDAFYDGTTSLDEEKILRQYFSGKDVPEELEVEQKIFCELFSAQGGYDFSSLEQKLDSLIEQLEDKEKSHIQSFPPKLKSIINWKWITSVAASVLIILCTGIYFYNQNNTHKMIDTYSNPKEAYAETQKALTLVSSKLNKGFDQMGSAQKNIEKTNKIIAKNIQL